MKNTLLKISGLIALGLGIVGAFLPVMPTTCFVLFAAWCFAKSSPYWHQRLRSNKVFGDIITSWEQQRCIPPKACWIASLSIIGFGIFSLIMIESAALQIALIIFMIAGLGAIHWFSKCRSANYCPYSQI